MSGEWDVSEIRTLATDLGKASLSAAKDADKVLKRGAQNIKTALAEQAAGSRHGGFRVMGRESIDYDSPADLAYEIGPNKGKRGGALGNIFFFGTSKGGGSGDLDAPLQEESPRIEKHMEDLIGRILW